MERNEYAFQLCWGGGEGGERRRCEVVQWPARGAACSRCTGELYHAEKYTRDLASRGMNQEDRIGELVVGSRGVASVRGDPRAC